MYGPRFPARFPDKSALRAASSASWADISPDCSGSMMECYGSCFAPDLTVVQKRGCRYAYRRAQTVPSEEGGFRLCRALSSRSLMNGTLDLGLGKAGCWNSVPGS